MDLHCDGFSFVLTASSRRRRIRVRFERQERRSLHVKRGFFRKAHQGHLLGLHAAHPCLRRHDFRQGSQGQHSFACRKAKLLSVRRRFGRAPSWDRDAVLGALSHGRISDDSGLHESTERRAFSVYKDVHRGQRAIGQDWSAWNVLPALPLLLLSRDGDSRHVRACLVQPGRLCGH